MYESKTKDCARSWTFQPKGAFFWEMVVGTSFVAVFSIFRFASFAKNLKGEDDEELFVLVSALRSANVFPYALLFDVDLTEKKGSWFLHKPKSFLLTRQGHFFLLTQTLMVLNTSIS